MTQTALDPGQVVDGRYTVARLVGRGAMADVFEARDERQHGLKVALKVLRGPIAHDPDARERFSREARAQQMVRHPNVAALHGAGIHNGAPYLAMELLIGRSLARVLHAEGRLAVDRAVGACWQALMGLNATHSRGILHRDLKPGNLMVVAQADGRERTVLIDFGFAALEGLKGLTQHGLVVGSLSYIAPERLRSEPIDERSDLYALAVVLYELVSGRRPFVAEDDAGLISAILEAEPDPPSAWAPEAKISPTLDQLILRALAKDPRDRPANAVAMAKELERT